MVYLLTEPIRDRKVNARVAKLAEERSRALQERERFYSSAEWLAVRKQVIEEDGQTCAECARTIHDRHDITVDHIQPRSKFPEFALSRENLRVLCRQCNSRKGSKDWLDPLESDDKVPRQ